MNKALYPISYRDPASPLRAWGEEEGSLLFDSGGVLTRRSRWQIFCRQPRHIIEIASDRRVYFDGHPLGVLSVAACFEKMRQVEKHFSHTLPAEDVPFQSGWAGFASYKLGLILQGLSHLVSDDGEPIFWAGFYDHGYIWDRQKGTCFLSHPLAFEDVDAFYRYLHAWEALPVMTPPISRKPSMKMAPLKDERHYCKMVSRAREAIARGAIFQVNITQQHRCWIPKSLSMTSLYQGLRSYIPAPFGAYLNCKDTYQLLSSSPESFVHIDVHGVIATRPIKGTIERGRTQREDAYLQTCLHQDVKERAENLMIVDLMRNDIGRVAQLGSVEVPQLLEVERFSHVHHLVSQVSAKLKENADALDLLGDVLPAGSVTGAPKIEALKMIAEIERYSRGAYCGIIFTKDVMGRFESSVIIRTMVRHQDMLSVGTGGGITYLSDPRKEYQEMLLKWEAFREFLEM